jgi:site-specific DNA recombinase
MIAELELDRIRESWSSAINEAVKRGVHVSSRPPTGYRRDEGGRLVREEPAATAVREVFLRRALGASWAELARYLDAEGVRPPTGNPFWSKVGVSGIVKNPVYLGQARGGRVTNDNAHEALVTRAEFDGAQSTKKSLLKQRDGSVASKAMLGGLVFCAGCGHTLKITGNTDRKTGERYPMYYCSGQFATGPCPSRANVRSSLLDAHVEQLVFEALTAQDGGLLANALSASEAIDAADRAVDAAEHELDLFVTNATLMTVIGEKLFLEGAEVRQNALEDARDKVGQLRQQSSLATEIADGDIVQAWPTLGVQDKRRLLQGLLDRVVVSRADGRGRHASPIGGRTEIVVRGNVVLGRDSSARAAAE